MKMFARIVTCIVAFALPFTLGFTAVMFFIYKVGWVDDTYTDLANTYFGLRSFQLLADDYFSFAGSYLEELVTYAKDFLKSLENVLKGFAENTWWSDTTPNNINNVNPTNFTEFFNQFSDALKFFHSVWGIVANLLGFLITALGVPFIPIIDLLICFVKALTGVYNIPIPSPYEYQIPDISIWDFIKFFVLVTL